MKRRIKKKKRKKEAKNRRKKEKKKRKRKTTTKGYYSNHTRAIQRAITVDLESCKCFAVIRTIFLPSDPQQSLHRRGV